MPTYIVLGPDETVGPLDDGKSTRSSKPNPNREPSLAGIVLVISLAGFQLASFIVRRQETALDAAMKSDAMR